KLPAVRGSELAPARRPLWEPPESRAEDRRLQFVEPRVEPGFGVMVAIGLATVAQPAESLRQRAIAGHDRPAVAERREVLRRVEAERAGDSDRADRTAGGNRDVGLA